MDIFEKVEAVIADRKQNPKEGSYTNYLLEKGLDKILKKFSEESAETVIAAKNTDRGEVIYEAADMLYHLLVLLHVKDIKFSEIKQQLEERHGK